MSAWSGARLFGGLVLLGCVAAAVAGWPGAQAQQQSCPLGAQAIGLSRTVEITSSGGARFGQLQYPGKDFLRDGEVVLTFDDGPHKAYTRPILDALDAHCTRATFFMVGQRAIGYWQLVREVAQRGHTVGTHTWSHRNQKQISADAARAETELGISAVQRALGAPAAPFFRFPYLADPSHMREHLKARNTSIWSIDIDSYDFRTRSPSKVIHNVMSQLAKRKKGIILFHDIQPSTAAALRTLLGELKAKGYKVVHVRPAAPQVTLAEFDKRLPKLGAPGALASVATPVASRGFMSPSWEMRVVPTAAPAPPQRPVLAERRAPAEDWRNTVFRSY